MSLYKDALIISDLGLNPRIKVIVMGMALESGYGLTVFLFDYLN